MPTPKIVVCMGPWQGPVTSCKCVGLTNEKSVVTFRVFDDGRFRKWKWSVSVADGVYHADYADDPDSARAAIESYVAEHFEFVKPVKEQLADAQQKIAILEDRVAELEKSAPKFKLGDRVLFAGSSSGVVHRITKVCLSALGDSVVYGLDGGSPSWRSELLVREAAE